MKRLYDDIGAGGHRMMASVSLPERFREKFGEVSEKAIRDVAAADRRTRSAGSK